ncbi:type 2 lantibiotic biosynthesis protein LanM [Dyella sp. OK004]|uniref:type 2 lanthipeptide synthetase LanM family protein n=1 Tax=Dyella sp. OK004 TaxID=1855292 RepID=UPI0008E6FB13|nr:type 2 lanthipeptide synthetase LanM family protein [Dyella sp. OK004]SFS13755.1 type 2 lantibiotic biosynthesis protein LanM [Dyella sp. OK004]
MVETSTPDAFARIIEHFTASTRAAFAARLAELSTELDLGEAASIRSAAEEAVHNTARLKLNRVLLLELHAAKRAGELTAEDDAGRFAQFVERSLQPEFAEHLDRRYPPLRKRLQRALSQQRTSIETLLMRFIADRSALARLLGRPAGRLTALTLGQGDLHAGGQAVARLSLEGGEVMYKPRSLRIDSVLDAFLAGVFGATADRIRVPEVIDRGDYGWAAYVVQRHCESEDELRIFYRGLGHWLAVLRLLGGTDIHLENLIAAGPVPVVIDVESLFAVIDKGMPSPYGQAYDLAQVLIRSSVLRTGIVPYRAPALGFDGVDISAAGALPNQQPQVHAPIIVGEGTTEARLKVINVDVTPARNHPGSNPDVSLYWDQISEGFLAATAQLRKVDTDGQLMPLLAAFEHCQARDIRRPTQAYMEIGRMLWHPASLHDEAKAIERARDLLARNALVVSIAPSAAQEIAAEIDDLRYGDVPVFAAPLTRARIDAAVADWRAMRIDLEELTIRSALVATKLNRSVDEPVDNRRHYFARHPHTDRLDARRRKLALEAVERLLRLAVRGDDGSVTWITPETTQSGWLVQPLQADVYFGLGGVVIALAGYVCEVECGRADMVPGIEETLDGALHILQTLVAADKPRTIGGFSGYGAQIWTWLTLHDLLRRPELIANAVTCAEALAHEGFDNDLYFDIIDGASGAIVPLLQLAEATDDARWLALAARAARHLEAAAIVDARGARWRTPVFAEPIGGFAHGAVGIGWSLARLALTDAGDEADRMRWSALADAAFAFQDSLYDETLGNWLDMRQLGATETFHTWCNGSVGIGLAASDLYARTRDPRHLRTLRRAVAASHGQWGSSHTLCHGDLSLWELFVRAAALDPDVSTIDPDEPTAQVISAIEEHHGVIGGMTRAAFTPGLMTGLAGAIHSLNRMHPDCRLASPLLLERRS